MTFYVYVLYRDLECTQPFYVGKGSGERYKRHAAEATRGRGKNPLKLNIAAKCLRDFGHVPFRIERKDITEIEAFALERALITLWGRRDLGLGGLANCTDGGEGASGHKRTPEVIAALTAWNTGSKRSPEQRAKMSAWQIGRKMSDEAVAKTKAAKIGYTWSDARRAAFENQAPLILTPERRAQLSEQGKANTGQKRTDEQRAKMSVAAKARDPATRKGIPKSEATRAKISAALKLENQKNPELARARMLVAQRARWVKRDTAASPIMEAGA